MGEFARSMKNLHAKLTVKIPDGVTVDVKSRNVVVKGPRGTLTKSFKHMSIDLFKPDANTVQVEKGFSLSKEQAVIKGFQYRMKMVYAHFPTNAQIANDGKSVAVVN